MDRESIDEVWLSKIVPAVKAGRLGSEAKVSTAAPSTYSRKPGEHVICVYTANAEDRAEIMRVRQELRELGFAANISYKTDAATREGRYEGSGRVAKYFE